MSFRQFLLEGRDSPLYHATQYSTIESILKENTIRGNTYIPSRGIKSKRKYQKEIGDLKGISLTRNIRFAREWLNGLWTDGAILEIDQAKLVRNYKLMPYNFYSHTGTRISSDELGLEFYGDVGKDHPYNQYEEVVIGNIKAADKYITKIIVFDDKWSRGQMLKDHHLIYDFKTKKFVNK